MTPEDRVDALTQDTHRDILIRLIKTLEAEGLSLNLVNTLHEWSLVDRTECLPAILSNGAGGYASPTLCPKHKVPYVCTITDETLCAVCEKAKAKEAS